MRGAGHFFGYKLAGMEWNVTTERHHQGNGLIGFDELKTFSGYQTRGRVEHWLEKNRIPYFLSKRGPTTTITAMNTALGITPSHDIVQELKIKR